MSGIDMDAPVPELRLDDGKARSAFLLSGIVGETVAMTIAHLVEVLKALTPEQRHEVIGQALGLGHDERFDGEGEQLESLLSARDSIRVFRDCAHSALDRADAEKARADLAEAVVEEAVAYQSEGPRCLFCSRGTETHVVSGHAANCALVSAGYVTREGARKLKELETKDG